MSRQITREEWAEIRRASEDALAAFGTDVLLPYQQRADRLLETAAVVVVEKSRRIGLTWGLAFSAVTLAARARTEGGMDVLYISYSQEMTRGFIDACAMWARLFALAAADEEEFLFDDVDPNDPAGTRQIQAFLIRFASGFEIMGLSSAPRSLRGKQGLCIIDEAAFVDSLKELLKAALAFLMWGGKVVVCSTHNGAGNAFNDLVQDVLSGRLPYAHLRIDLDDALRDGLYRRICQVTSKVWTPEAEAAWRADLIASYGDGADEELFCVPSEGDGVWLATSLIEARMTAEGEPLRLELPADFLQRHPLERKGLMEAAMERFRAAIAGRFDPAEVHGLGFDFARKIDLSVATVLGLGRDLVKRERFTVELRRWPYSEQAELLIELIKGLPRWQAALMDATGSGEAVAEAVMRARGDKVVAIKLSAEWYRLNMPILKRDFEDGAIALIKDREHREDLRIVQVARGVPVIPSLRTGAGGKKRHGDFAVALALAHAALRADPATIAYTAVPLAAAPLFGKAEGRLFFRPNHDDDDRRTASRELRGAI